MRTLVKWCLSHNLKWFLWIMLGCMLPIYLLSYIKEGYRDWVLETDWLRDAK